MRNSICDTVNICDAVNCLFCGACGWNLPALESASAAGHSPEYRTRCRAFQVPSRSASAVPVQKRYFFAFCRVTMRFKVWSEVYDFGSVKLNTLPLLDSLSTPTVPPWFSTICLTMLRPKPVPPDARLRALSAR